jgi:hypothetical protein
MRRDFVLEQVLGLNWLMAAAPTIIAWRAAIQQHYQWGLFGVTGEGSSSAFFWLILPMAGLGWVNFILGSRRPESWVFPVLLLAWNGIWFGVSLYGAITLGEKMTLRGDALGMNIPVNVVAPAVTGVLAALSIYWVAVRRGRTMTPTGKGRAERVLLIIGLALTPVFVALFAVGAHQRGGLQTDWDRAAVLVFIPHMILVGLSINPWRNRFGEKS